MSFTFNSRRLGVVRITTELLFHDWPSTMKVRKILVYDDHTLEMIVEDPGLEPMSEDEGTEVPWVTPTFRNMPNFDVCPTRPEFVTWGQKK